MPDTLMRGSFDSSLPTTASMLNATTPPWLQDTRENVIEPELSSWAVDASLGASATKSWTPCGLSNTKSSGNLKRLVGFASRRTALRSQCRFCPLTATWMAGIATS
jgi:hypothetical protein